MIEPFYGPTSRPMTAGAHPKGINTIRDPIPR